MTTKYIITMLNRKPKPKTADTQRRASHSSVDIGEVLVQQDKTNKLSTAFNPTPFKVVSKNGNSFMVKSPTVKQYSKNTGHVNQYVSLPTEEPTTRLLDSDECLDLRENIGAKSEPCTS